MYEVKLFEQMPRTSVLHLKNGVEKFQDMLGKIYISYNLIIVIFGLSYIRRYGYNLFEFLRTIHFDKDVFPLQLPYEVHPIFFPP